MGLGGRDREDVTGRMVPGGRDWEDGTGRTGPGGQDPVDGTRGAGMGGLLTEQGPSTGDSTGGNRDDNFL